MNNCIECSYFIGRAPGAGDIYDKSLTAQSFSTDDNTVRRSALLCLLQHLLSEPAFDQLRTKEQLGYIANVSTKCLGRIEVLRFIVQSNHKDPDYLNSRIEDFLKTYRSEVIETMTEEFLAQNLSAVIENLLEPPKNIFKVSSIFAKARSM